LICSHRLHQNKLPVNVPSSSQRTEPMSHKDRNPSKVASVVYQGSHILQIHLFYICKAALGEAFEYLIMVIGQFGHLISKCFCRSPHNWVPTVPQPSTPCMAQREHVDEVIRNWRSSGDFKPTSLPAQANNILSDEVQHWVRTYIPCIPA
jgi:hypothetical protein